MNQKKFKQKNLSYEMYQIRKFCRYHLIKCTNHALMRAKERNISFDDIYSMLLMPTSTIVHQKVLIKDRAIRYVIFLKKLGKNMRYHVIIQKNIKVNGGINYEIVTLYEPDRSLFRNDGRLRTLHERQERITYC